MEGALRRRSELILMGQGESEEELLSDVPLKKKLDDLPILKKEEVLHGAPWAKKFLSEMHAMTEQGVLHWISVVSKVGQSEVEMATSLGIYKTQVKELLEDLLLDMETVQEKMFDKISQALTNIQQVCRDLKQPIPNYDYEGVSYGDLYRTLLNDLTQFKSLVKTRKDELQVLHQQMIKLCSAMGRVPNLLPESPLPSEAQVENLRSHIEALENEVVEREERFFKLREEICEVVQALKIKPNLQFEERVLDIRSETDVMVSNEDMKQLELYHERVMKMKMSMKERAEELRVKIEDLWNRLEIDIGEQSEFREKITGFSTEAISALEREHERLEEKKRENIKMYIEKQKLDLQQIWEKCRCSEREKSNFTFFDSDCYTEDLFELFEREIHRWRAYHDDNNDILRCIEEHENLWKRRLDMETQQSEGVNRYKNRGGRLLAEEKIRNMLLKKIPQLENQLYKLAATFELRNGHQFLTYGKTLDEHLAELHSEFDKAMKEKLSAKKMERDQKTVGSSNKSRHLNFNTPSTSSRHPQSTPRSNPPPKRMLLSSASASKRMRTPATAGASSAAKLPTLKLNTSKARKESRKRRLARLSQSLCSNKENNETMATDYVAFEKNLMSKDKICRSTDHYSGIEKHLQQSFVPPQTPVKLAPLDEGRCLVSTTPKMVLMPSKLFPQNF